MAHCDHNQNRTKIGDANEETDRSAKNEKESDGNEERKAKLTSEKAEEKINEKKKEERGGGQKEETDEAATQPSPSSEGNPNSLPNLYSKFVNSFESVIQNLAADENSTGPKQKLPSLDLEGVATFIREERPDIVFMVGAGISTSAGIPDFRTPGTGLYDNLKQFNLPHPQAIFEINYFKQNPEPFFVLAKELFHENIKPTPAHYFIRLLEQKGLLRRCFTQNIDALEYLAGVDDDKIVTAHGSHRTNTCLSCGAKFGQQWLLDQLKSANVPRCVKCKSGVVKPDIVFFGESLPAQFFSRSFVDLPKCELLIIMGTSLVVHPFASLVHNVSSDTPRLLINLEPVGADSLHYENASNIRDVFWRGECDAGVKKLAELLGWEHELQRLVDQGKNKK